MYSSANDEGMKKKKEEEKNPQGVVNRSSALPMVILH
jgi:hypothetical protein